MVSRIRRFSIARQFLFSSKYSRLYRVHYKKKDKTITDNLLIHIYINRANIKLVLKIKDRITNT